VLLRTDYPFDWGQGNPVDFIAAAGLTDDQRAQVLGRNAEELFSLTAIRRG
jgi:predicted TIM-barrel fold metal-dependent hydrolase